MKNIGEVKMDFSAYDAKDFYSDGGVEEEIFFHAKAGDLENFLRSDNRFPVLCHLSPLRNFLLEWLPVEKNDSVLEIGCGLGALTGTLLKTGATVDAVEISPRRAQIPMAGCLSPPWLDCRCMCLSQAVPPDRFFPSAAVPQSSVLTR